MAVSEVLQVLTAVSLVGGGGRGIGETIHPRGVSRKFGRLILDGHQRLRNFDLLGASVACDMRLPGGRKHQDDCIRGIKLDTF